MMISMPGESWKGALPEISAKQKALSEEIRGHVSFLADNIGERNFLHYENLCDAADYIEDVFRKAGYEPIRQDYVPVAGIISEYRGAKRDENRMFSNIIAEKKGDSLPEEIFIVGSHYDSVPVDGCRAANDNASGVAATLALARIFAGRPTKRTLRFIAFVNEEPPYFWTAGMGSYVYAMECKRKKEKIIGMITPETIGYYSDDENSQDYPFPMSWFYPSKGNFIAFVGNTSSMALVRDFTRIFREKAQFPSEGAALPGFIPGIWWSDHWSFWKAGYSALMVTDTAPFRYPYYHTAQDNTDKIDFDRTARVALGLADVVAEFANR